MSTPPDRKGPHEKAPKPQPPDRPRPLPHDLPIYPENAPLDDKGKPLVRP